MRPFLVHAMLKKVVDLGIKVATSSYFNISIIKLRGWGGGGNVQPA